jgi:large subunit ribosomal protein L18
MTKVGTRLARKRRHQRVRARVTGTALKPRLCVFRSLNHIYAQVTDDVKGHTITAASTLEPEVSGEAKGKKKTARAELAGSLLAKRAIDKGIQQVVFDRGGYKYHGRVKAFADAARQAGLKF